LSPASRRLRPRDVIAHFEGVVMQELDLRIESSAAGEFAANTEGDAGFVVPPVEWYLSSRRVMTLGWAEGITLSDLAAIDAAGHDRKALATRVLQMFLRHALRDGFFHGDMHQGNLKVAPNGDIVALDFGIMGRIDEYTRRVYAEILYGFHPQGLPPRGRGAFRSRIRTRPTAISGSSRKRCGPWESRSSAWMPAASRWRGSWRICSKSPNASEWKPGPS
jgi:hypothetical protein